MSPSFQILLTGIQFRRDRRDVRNNLAKLFKCEEDRIEQLLGRAPISIKTVTTMEAALKYQKAIQDAGAECVVKHAE